MRYHVLQHISFETPGVLADLIRRRGHSLETTALYDDEPLPSLEQFDELIVMGGPMSIHDEREFPWLVAEKKLIGSAIRAGKKVLGICLGAQLIAAICGARVYQNAQKEIGWWPVKWADPAFGSSANQVVFHWHGETFDLPDGAVLLASSEACINQAFSLGDKVLAIQFHPEVTGEIIREMVTHEGWELLEAAGSPYVQRAHEILADSSPFGCGNTWLLEWLCPIQV